MDWADAPLLVLLLVPEADEEVAVEVPVGLDSEPAELVGACAEGLESKVVEGFCALAALQMASTLELWPNERSPFGQ